MVQQQPEFGLATLGPGQSSWVRLEMWREGVEDFDYVVLLEKRIEEAAGRGGDAAAAQALLRDLGSMFHDQVHWSVNDEYYLRLRNEIAMQIESLNQPQDP
jgi:hypothetical protein